MRHKELELGQVRSTRPHVNVVITKNGVDEPLVGRNDRNTKNMATTTVTTACALSDPGLCLFCVFIPFCQMSHLALLPVFPPLHQLRRAGTNLQYICVTAKSSTSPNPHRQLHSAPLHYLSKAGTNSTPSPFKLSVFKWLPNLICRRFHSPTSSARRLGLMFRQSSL